MSNEHLIAFSYCESARRPEVRATFNACSDKRYAYAHVVDNDVYVAPTTGRALDWALNFVIAPLVGLPLQGTLHIGFASVAQALYPRIIRHLDKNKPVRLYGYSQGGAVALILNHWLTLKGYKVSETITFASPRPYTLLYWILKRFTRSGIIINYITRGDWVSLSPPWMVRMGKTVRLGTFKEWRPVWIAHQPYTYEERLRNLL